MSVLRPRVGSQGVTRTDSPISGCLLVSPTSMTQRVRDPIAGTTLKFRGACAQVGEEAANRESRTCLTSSLQLPFPPQSTFSLAIRDKETAKGRLRHREGGVVERRKLSAELCMAKEAQEPMEGGATHHTSAPPTAHYTLYLAQRTHRLRAPDPSTPLPIHLPVLPVPACVYRAYRDR